MTPTTATRSAHADVDTVLARVLERLSGVVRSGDGHKARCPAHDDRRPSLSVNVGDDGRILLKCRAGCYTGAVLAPIGLTMRDLFPPQERRTGRETVYAIRDAAGAVVAEHVRLDRRDGKRMHWRRPGGSLGLGGLHSAELPLYGCERIATAPATPVVVVEGEKATDALTRRGIVAVGTVTGAATLPTDDVLRVLADRDVVLWPDAGAPGRGHMTRIAARLVALGIAARWYDPAPEATDGRDAADDCRDPEALRAALVAARPCEARVREPGEDDGDAEAPAPRFRLLRGDAILSIPPPRWIVRGLLQADSLAVLYGAPGTGKSFVALDVALHLGHALPWQGRDVGTGGGVVYVAAEGGGGLGIRCRAWAEWHHRPLPEGVALVDEAPDLYSADTDAQALVDAITASYGATPPAAVVIDTLARAMAGGEENSNADMALVIGRCDRIRRALGATVVLVHHTTKADAERERGATALRGAADTMLLVTADGPLVTLTCDKQKNGCAGARVALELRPVELAGVEDGSCVVVAAQATATAHAHAETAYRILAEQFEGQAAWTRWSEAFCASTGKAYSTFVRAHAALREARRVHKAGRVWAVLP